MFPIRDSKPNSSINKKKDAKKPITDTYYNKVSYRESRNIFSSNEPVDPENRLYTDTATHMHQFWTDTIIGAKSSDIAVNNDKPAEGEKLINSQITQNFLKELSKLNKNTNYTPIGCKKCGYVGHFSYECRNNTKFLKKEKNSNNIDKNNKNSNGIKNEKMEMKNQVVIEAEKLLKKKKKKEKKAKKDKNERKEKSRKSISSSKEVKHRERSSSERKEKRISRSSSKDERQKTNQTKKRKYSKSSSDI